MLRLFDLWGRRGIHDDDDAVVVLAVVVMRLVVERRLIAGMTVMGHVDEIYVLVKDALACMFDPLQIACSPVQHSPC